MSEIEDFLRKVAQRRQQLAQQQKQLSGSPPTAPPTAPPSTPAASSSRGMVRRGPAPPLGRVPSRSQIVDAEILDDEGDDVSSADVVRHVAQHLSTREFTERAEHLGEATRKAEQRLEQQVQQHFQSTGKSASVRPAADAVSSIAPTAQVDAPESGPSLLEMLHDPANLRNAILLSEILRRPEERW